MPKFISIVLVVMGVAFGAWQFHQYATSGEVIASFPLNDLVGNSEVITLDKTMNPLRLTLSSIYEAKIETYQIIAYSYDVNLIGPGGMSAFSANGSEYPQQEQEAAHYKEQVANHILGTFDVSTADGYIFDWQIKPIKGKISELELTLRRNVTDINILFAATAGLMFVGGLLIGIFGRRKLKPLNK